MADFGKKTAANRARAGRIACSPLGNNFTAHVHRIAVVALPAIIWAALPSIEATRPEPAPNPVILTFVVDDMTLEAGPAGSVTPESVTDGPLPFAFKPAAVPLMIPVKGVDPTELTDSFQARRGGNRRHKAIDIVAPLNTPIVAAETGIIAKLHDSASGGLSIYQYDSTSSYVYYYAHLHRYPPGLKEGKTVRQGEVIGYVGQTGNAETPHLHFAVAQLGSKDSWWGGTPINPYPLLNSAGD
jgi:peptidoglycan LD-endopeptidase LytH